MLSFSLVDYLYLFFAALTIYFFVLYMLLHNQNRKKMHEVKLTKVFPLISIIIPAWNEEKTIADTIKNVINLDWPKNKKEVIVVSDGSTDKTVEIAKKFPDVKIIEKENGGKASALNLGIKNSKGKFVACTDADSYPEKDALRKMMASFEEKGVGVVTSTILVKSPTNFLQKFQELEYYLISWNRKLLEFLEGIYVTPGPLSIYRKEAVKKVGFFDEKNITEDIEMTWRLQRHNYKVRACLPAKVYTTAPSKIRVWWKQRIRWHLGGEQTLVKHFSVFRDVKKSRLNEFIAPINIISYLTTLLGVSTLFYVLGSSIYDFMTFHTLATTSGISLENQFRLSAPVFLPNIFMIFGVLVFATSIVYTYLGMKAIDGRKMIVNWKDAIYLLAYLTAYVTVFPITLLHSFWRYGRNRFEW